MLTRFATIISYVLHPLLMPTLLLFIVFSSDTYITLSIPAAVQKTIYALVLVTTVLIPVSTSFYLYRKGVLKTMQMESIEERKIPYIITSLFYFFTYYLLRKVHVSSVLSVLFLGATVALVSTMIINLKWKISAHMVGIGGVIGALIGISLRLFIDFRILIIVFLLLAGVIGIARMLLKAHNPSQIYIGFLVGCASQLLLFFIA